MIYVKRRMCKIMNNKKFNKDTKKPKHSLRASSFITCKINDEILLLEQCY